MKQIFLKVYPNGKTSTNATVLNFDHEHNTGEIVIDYTSVDYLDWEKQLDLVFADGTHTFVVGNGNTLTVPLLESYLKKGSMTVQPLAKRLVGETYEKIKWQMVALSVRDSLNVLEDDTSITPSVAEQWEIRIEAVEQEELTRQSNEGTRVSNENTRISNENTRILQENSRVSAENTRAEFYEGFNNELYKNMQLSIISSSPKKTEIFAHRGINNLAPENTLPAYKIASRCRIYGAETDIARTSDGYFVLMHDNTVDRMTDGTGDVNSLTLAQIQSFKIDFGGNIGQYPNLKVPTLGEFLITCKKYNLVPLLDCRLTSVHAAALLTEIQKYGMEGSCIVANTDLSMLQALRNISSVIKIQLLIDFNSTNIDTCVALKNADINVPIEQLTQELVNEAHLKGIKVNCWTATTYSQMLNAINMGVDFVTADNLTYSGDRNND